MKKPKKIDLLINILVNKEIISQGDKNTMERNIIHGGLE